MNTNEIEKQISIKVDKDLIKLAKSINKVIEDFASEKGITYNYLHFINDSSLVKRLDEYEATCDPNGYPYFEHYYKRNDKYENSLGGVEELLHKMLQKTFFNDLHEKKVSNLLDKVNFLDD